MDKLEKRQQNLLKSKSFSLAHQLKIWLDDYHLDAVIGLIPVAGDFITQIFNLVFLYISAIKLKSFRLSILMIFNSLFDFTLGLIPYIGSILDFFNKSYKQNFALISGYALGDEQTMKKINKQSLWAIFGILILCVLIYFFIKFSIYILKVSFEFLSNLF